MEKIPSPKITFCCLIGSLILSSCAAKNNFEPRKESQPDSEPQYFTEKPYRHHLPLSTTFLGGGKFNQIMAQATPNHWQNLPMGERVAKFGTTMLGTPYKGYTLEIDDRIEAPSANFNGLDCWTFFEIALGLARMVEKPRSTYTPTDLLREIEHTRYRHGVCNAHYLDRIHYLIEWFRDNENRGNIDDITLQLGGRRHPYKRVKEMTTLWKGYRYLRENPEYLKPMDDLELKISRMPAYYIPKSKVKSIEHRLRNGDIIGIVTEHDGGYCCHVGLIIKKNGQSRFMHASSKHKKVLIDDTVSGYLHQFKTHSGIMVARPKLP